MPIKIDCPNCLSKLVLKHDVAPARIKCPKCAQPFRPRPVEAARPDAGIAASAAPLPVTWKPGGNAHDLMRAVVQAFKGQVVSRRPKLGYRLALLLTACGLCLLIAAYLACIVGLGWGMYLYATSFIPASFQIRGRAMFVVGLMHVAVLFSGAALLFSLVSALFSWHRTQPEGMLLTPTEHPVVHCFVRALCSLINAPQPDQIRLSPEPNASAGRHGGVFGIVGGRLILTIGEPLFYGLELRSLAGIIAHELGHFSQATSGILIRFIANVSDWFARATHRSGNIQSAVGEHGDSDSGYVQMLVLIVFCVTGLGRLVLMLFGLCSRMTTYYLSRQMEFDADRYEAEVAGSAQFARTFERLIELQTGWETVVRSIVEGVPPHHESLSFAEIVVAEANALSERGRRRVARQMSPKRSQWFDTHPSPTERIAAVARQPRPGIFQLEGPAVCLLKVSVVPDASP